MVSFVNSFKKFSIILVFLIVLSLSTVYLFDQFVATPINVFTFSRETFRIILIVGFWLIILLFLQRAKPFMTVRIGAPAATVLQFAIGAIAVLVMSFGVLHTLGVSPESLLTGAGIATITIGLIISTFVGGILAGALVFTTHSFRVGDDVLVNNIPGRITDMTVIVTKIATDVGQMSIPNSAIASGAVIMIHIHQHEVKSPSRLPYAVGDRVVSTFMNEEGVVKELTPLHTVIALNSGRELTLLNNSVLSGGVTIAKIVQTKGVQPKTKEKSED
ncbi:MAG TPA: mechanosensitive ion channel domain-containing protein [Candidatus Acidoferrum sp.]|nr:mechanosensitive ion channel domain-containing protein [Candidatus Acidoferrum sp.]